MVWHSEDAVDDADHTTNIHHQEEAADVDVDPHQADMAIILRQGSKVNKVASIPASCLALP